MQKIASKILVIIVWFPIILVAQILGRRFFGYGTFLSYTFALAWVALNYYVIKKLRSDQENILMIRLISYFFVECAILAIVLLFS